METKALGKGLSALIPEKSALSKDESVEYVQVKSIIESTLQPRLNYDSEKLEDLKASIKEKGLLQPIIVRRKGEGFEVIAGERRLKAIKDLKIDKIPAVIKNVTDAEAFVIALIENIQREELNPIEQAEAYRKLINDFDYTQESVAKSVGKDRTTITNLLRILNLPAEIQKSVFDGVISVGHARALVGVESVVERSRLYELSIKKGISVRELENLINASTKGGVRRGKTPAAKSRELIALEEELQKVLGTKVRIKASRKRGKIEIDYYSADDLKRIIQRLAR